MFNRLKGNSWRVTLKISDIVCSGCKTVLLSLHSDLIAGKSARGYPTIARFRTELDRELEPQRPITQRAQHVGRSTKSGLPDAARRALDTP